MNPSNKRGVVGYILFHGIQIENANALSGNLIYGTPALTGIKGSFHAMSRRLMTDKQTAPLDVRLRGVMIACHEYLMYASRGESFREYHFTQKRPAPTTANDLAKMNVGTLPSVIQEAQCYVKMSFVVEVVSNRKLVAEQKATLIKHASKIIQQQRLAGGNVSPFNGEKRVTFIDPNNLESLPYKLSKCNILTDASDVMLELMKKNPTLSATDILIDIVSNHHIPTKNEQGDQTWHIERTAKPYGWIVPLAVGYHGITREFEAGLLENSRSIDYASQYVESVYSLGRWSNPHKLQLEGKLKDAFWYYNHQSDNSLYLITSNPNH